MTNRTRKIIAEIGSVHDGSIGNALKMVDLAKDCGANVVKFQLHISSEEMIDNAASPPYFKSENRKDYFDRISFTLIQLRKIFEYCRRKKIEFLCSPFSNKAVDVLNNLGVNAFKIASGELTNHYMLEKISKTKKKVYLSTGMSSLGEINMALKILKSCKVVLMQCTSMYPCPEDKVGLNIIQYFKKKYDYEVGFSDHYLGFEAGYAAAAIGANVIEKHITFSRKMYGSDAQFAMEPKEFKIYVKGIKKIWRMLDYPVDKNKLTHLQKMKNIFEKGIYFSKDLAKGQTICIDDISFKKPSGDIPASDYKKYLGKKLKKNVKKNQLLKKIILC